MIKIKSVQITGSDSGIEQVYTLKDGNPIYLADRKITDHNYDEIYNCDLESTFCRTLFIIT